MVDETLKTWLIEVNSNPCLKDWSCPLLKNMLPVMVNQMLDKIINRPPSAETAGQALANGGVKGAGDIGQQTSLDPSTCRRFEMIANVKLEQEVAGQDGNE